MSFVNNIVSADDYNPDVVIIAISKEGAGVDANNYEAGSAEISVTVIRMQISA